MSLRARVAAVIGNEMVRDVIRLVTGTLGGRLITLGAMPLVTRLYSPEDFSLLAVYLGTVSIVGAVTCLRFDVAVPVADNDEDAGHLLILALIAALVVSALSLAAALLAPAETAALLGQPVLAPWLWLVSLGILFSGAYAALQSWATRARRFSSIAVTRVTQAVIGVSTTLTLGWAGVAPFGLMLGNMLNLSAGGLRLGLEALRQDRTALAGVTRRSLAAAFARYRRFPLYSAPEALANLAGTQVPILLVASIAGKEAGFLLLAQMAMAAPMTLLGSSISLVYVSRAPAELQEGRLASFTVGVLRRLIQTGVGPLMIAGIGGPILFPLIFGSDWARAGEIMAWMVPWMVLQFVASPISMVMHVVGRQRAMLVLTTFGAIVRVGMTLIAGHAHPELLSESYAASGAIFYGVCLLVFIRASGSRLRDRDAMRQLLTVVAALVVYASAFGIGYFLWP